MIVQAGSQTFGFADGNGGGHSCGFGAPPTAGQLDVIGISSDTTVHALSGWTVATSHVSNAGAYLYYRFGTGSESPSQTVVTDGNFNTTVSWSRWNAAKLFDQPALAAVDSDPHSISPAVTTPALAGTGELVLAFAAPHGGATSAPMWSSGYTGLSAIVQGSGDAHTVSGYVGYKLTAGPAAESPSVSWTGVVTDQYILVASFTPQPAAVSTKLLPNVSGPEDPHYVGWTPQNAFGQPILPKVYGYKIATGDLPHLDTAGEFIAANGVWDQPQYLLGLPPTS